MQVGFFIWFCFYQSLTQRDFLIGLQLILLNSFIIFMLVLELWKNGHFQQSRRGRMFEARIKCICWVVFVRLIHRSRQRYVYIYTHMLAHIVCVYMACVYFISLLTLMKDSKGKYLGEEIHFMFAIKHKEMLRSIQKDLLMLVTRESFTFLKAIKI